MPKTFGKTVKLRKAKSLPVKIETPIESDVKRSIVPLHEGFFPYGNLGLVNYHKKVKKGFTELDVLYPETLPPVKLTLDEVVKSQKKNFFTIYNSGWRLMYPTNYGMNVDLFSEYKGFVNRVHVLNFEDIFVSFNEREAMWLKNYEKIFDKMQYELERFAASFRSTKTVIIFCKGKTYTRQYTDMLSSLWKRWKFPFSDYPSHITFRFNVFTSSIPGITCKEKLAFIADQHRYFKHMICLIGDDLSLKELAYIAKNIGIRCTFDPFKCKDDGKFITTKSNLYTKMVKFATPPASSLNPPPIFMLKTLMERHEKGDKLLKHYSKISNVILYT